jgi:hypothetical protein
MGDEFEAMKALPSLWAFTIAPNDLISSAGAFAGVECWANALLACRKAWQ